MQVTNIYTKLGMCNFIMRYIYLIDYRKDVRGAHGPPGELDLIASHKHIHEIGYGLNFVKVHVAIRLQKGFCTR